jgi:RsiW-degrading membrane proteinase PrsW (M82 family)
MGAIPSPEANLRTRGGIRTEKEWWYGAFIYRCGVWVSMATEPEERQVIPLHRPDLQEKVFFFVSGIIISVPLTLYIGSFTDYLCTISPVSIFYVTICTTAIFTPLIEEFAKAYPLFYRHGETERSIITLGFLVGLGFGISEVLVYVLALGVPVPVRVPGLFFHAASTSITAYGIATKRAVRFYLVAVLLHFSNNLSALFGSAWLVGGVGAVLVSFLLAWYFFTRTSERFIAQT